MRLFCVTAYAEYVYKIWDKNDKTYINKFLKTAVYTHINGE